MFRPLIINPVEIGYRKTIVGWYNIYLIGCPKKSFVNVSPQVFSELFPAVSPKAVSGRDEMDRSCAQSLFASLKVSKTA